MTDAERELLLVLAKAIASSFDTPVSLRRKIQELLAKLVTPPAS